jgi:hypothetical protein
MSSVRVNVLLWAKRVLARTGAPAHQILEIPATASLEAAQEAFHEIARMAHPDLHRRMLDAEELELVELAYARAAGAYHDFRAQRAQAMRAASAANADASSVGRSRPDTANLSAAAPASTSASPASRMNSKAALYYRKAELCLRRGDLTGALLQMKLAIAGDPQSTFLRTALAELQAEIAKKK